MSAQQKPAWMRHMMTFLIIFVLGGMIMYRSRSCRPASAPGLLPPGARIVEIKIGRWYVQAEVADSPELHRKGLSGREALPPGYGMLFVYEEPREVEFWMKDTTIPLSIAFITDDGTIVQIEKLEPNSLRSVPSREPVKYALEVRQGWFEDRGLKAGIKAELPAEIPPATTPAPATEPTEPAPTTEPAEPAPETPE